MAVFKCKMCGGDLDISQGVSVVECEYCGTQQTVAGVDDEKKLNLFNRANRLRLKSEFDKAEGVYESIVAEFPEEAEAYWGLCLCKYGIEYVDDPKTALKVPTCHRTVSESILEDDDYKSALRYADCVAKDLYEKEAKGIDALQKQILEIAYKEEPYDVFISYKEKAYDGGRTRDSVLAQMVYDELTAKGYRVFFSRITLEDYIGREYEPYIYAALSSAKVMLVIGTKEEHFNAVWVKNEWSRFLAASRKDSSKIIIACYEGVEPEDIPEELRALQAQDLGKIGGIQDLVRGVGKLVDRKASKKSPEIVSYGDTIDDMLRKTKIHLENKKWKSAMESSNKILDTEPECAMAYVYHLARVMRVTDVEALAGCVQNIKENDYYKSALKYAAGELKEKLIHWAELSHKAYHRATEDCAPGIEKAKKVKDLISGGKSHTVALLPDGTVLACGSNDEGQCNVGGWRNIVALACGDLHTVGLCDDGTVVACGDNEHGQCSVSDWKGIVNISCDAYHTVGVRYDGTVVATGLTDNGRCEVGSWQNVKKAVCGYRHTVAQTADGALIAVGSNNYGQCDVTGWTDVADFESNNVHTVALRKNGVVLACGDNENKQIDVRYWRNIVDISCGTHHTAALKADGTVVATGMDDGRRCSGTSTWQNVISVVCGAWHTLGILSDGRVVACGNNSCGQCDVTGWKLFDDIDNIEKEREAAYGRKLETDKMAGYDVYISNDEKCNALAQTIAEKLIDNGYRVYYNTSAIERCIGPVSGSYRSSAMYSAKAMLVVGDTWDTFCSDKVKEEWTSYLELTEKEPSRLLIPCFGSTDMTGIPEELVGLHGQLVTKIEFINAFVSTLDKKVPKINRRIPELAASLKALQKPIIRSVHSIGANDPDDCWPRGSYSDTININHYSVVFFHAFVDKFALRHKRDVKTSLKIYNSHGDIMLDSTTNLSWQPDYDRFSKGWILKDDKNCVPTGKYRAVVSVDNSIPVVCEFMVTTGVNNYNNSATNGSFLKKLFNL